MNSDNRDTLKCLVEKHGELRAVDIVFEDGAFYGVWVDSYLNDIIYDLEDYEREYGDRYWNSLEDYKTGEAKSFKGWVADKGYRDVEEE